MDANILISFYNMLNNQIHYLGILALRILPKIATTFYPIYNSPITRA